MSKEVKKISTWEKIKTIGIFLLFGFVVLAMFSEDEPTTEVEEQTAIQEQAAIQEEPKKVTTENKKTPEEIETEKLYQAKTLIESCIPKAEGGQIKVAIVGDEIVISAIFENVANELIISKAFNDFTEWDVATEEYRVLSATIKELINTTLELTETNVITQILNDKNESLSLYTATNGEEVYNCKYELME